uniref:RNA 2',3'-cyclic phosphodiesterase n=1 Tax=Desulfovibrio sp. U5L TaxID=596152 RepID=I2Q6B8_9BACT
MDHVRAFVGIPLPDACQDLAADLGRRLASLANGAASPAKAGNIHLTLKFLGNVPVGLSAGEADGGPDGLPAVAGALAAIPFAPFTLRLGGGGFFPGPARPRVVWAALADGAGPCHTLARAVEAAMAPLGFAPEPKPFTAHLTLARLREPGRGGDWPGMLRLLAAAGWPAVPVGSFTLWRSILGPAGARHEVLAEFPATAA